MISGRSRGQRRLAVIVLVVAAALALAASPFRATWWGGWVLAIAEAGIVGGLADWFAVTALFRRPLGLPIPHTALIPANWELMAVRVGTMVGDRVLSKEYVTSEVARVDIADLLARAATRISREDLEALTATLARWIAAQLPSTVSRDFVSRVRRLAEGWPVAPVLASAIETARQHGWDERAIAALARALVDALEQPGFRRVIGELVDELLSRYRQQMGAYPRLVLGLADLFGLIDRERIMAALRAGLREMADDPDHPVRQRLARVFAELPDRLRTDAALAKRVETAMAELLASPVASRLLDEAMTELRRVIAEDLGRARPELAGWIADRLERGRQAIVTDAALRADVDWWIKAQITTLVDRHHARIATFIENGVRALGPEGAVRLIEEHAGDDLQYIRVNGTVVGSLTGGALYALHLLLAWL
jgi:uncharacterized membrane-anchored protein YjiN (DUF445 family)